LDIQDQRDTPYFRRYVESRGLGGRIKTYWKTNQTDKARLQTIVETECNGALDLVIDDASHLYRQTRASSEALFPLLMPGGLYIIEDWAWGHWPEFFSTHHAYTNASLSLTRSFIEKQRSLAKNLLRLFVGEKPLTRLVVELIEAAGTSTQLIISVVVYQGFVVVERGPQQLDKATHFNLKDYIIRRPSRRQQIQEWLSRLAFTRHKNQPMQITAEQRGY